MNTKSRLLGHCKEIVKARLFNAEDAMNRAQESANETEKSSAGDKFETGRAMGHLEKEMYARQYQKALHDLQKIESLDSKAMTTEVSLGSLVEMGSKFYLIAIGIGKVILDDKEYYVLSDESPIALSIIGKKKYDSITINGNRLQITDIQ
ncbi:MAG TPA: hypothetical protein PK622_09010 [Saprospiraceae bacterium]|nr:hypothetical protein [Saprospiraceae bacterium]HUN16939.1 hypothetical protein [Saprospiraceae bacterium]